MAVEGEWPIEIKYLITPQSSAETGLLINKVYDQETT